MRENGRMRLAWKMEKGDLNVSFSMPNSLVNLDLLNVRLEINNWEEGAALLPAKLWGPKPELTWL